jgi:predicted PurR-regulated permease PerM
MKKPMTDWDFLRRTLILAGVVIAILCIWQLSHAFLLLFGAVLLAVLLGSAADLFVRHLSMSRPFALAIVVILLLALFAGIAGVFGTRIVTQANDLAQRLPAAIDSIQQRFGVGDVWHRVLEQAKSNTGSILFQITTFAGLALNMLSDTFLVVIGAVYLAMEPGRYQRGALMLVPQEHRELAAKTINDAGIALRQWLIGQLIAMCIVGGLIGAGVWYIGLPAPIALGVVAALGEFVPILGPIIGSLPAIFLAVSMDWTTVAWTVGLFIVVLQLESNMIMPLIQNRMVALPPVLPLFAVIAFGLMFGWLGVVFATPLAVLSAVLVSRLYLREVLEEPAPIPGQQNAAE